LASAAYSGAAHGTVLQGADLVLIADCVPFAYANFIRLPKDHAVLVACPKRMILCSPG